MRCAWFVLLAVLIAAAPARAGGPYPAVPPENGVAPFIGPTWDAYRCAEGTIYNFYHGAYYGEEPPALYRGYAYRPYLPLQRLSQMAAQIFLRHGLSVAAGHHRAANRRCAGSCVSFLTNESAVCR